MAKPFTKEMADRYAALAILRVKMQMKYYANMKDFGFGIPQKPLTRKQKIQNQIRSIRIKLARFIAGNDWPEQY